MCCTCFSRSDHTTLTNHHQVISDVQLVHLRDQITRYKTLRMTTANMQEQQAAKAAFAQHAAMKAAAAKSTRKPATTPAPALHIADPVRLDIVVEDSEPLEEMEASQEASEPSISDSDMGEQGSRDSNLASDEEADTSDMCDDSDDGGRRKRGRRARMVCHNVEC